MKGERSPLSSPLWLTLSQNVLKAMEFAITAVSASRNTSDQADDSW
jgi:hypothetical protein